jgi:ribulose-phosphate 3-epimerase
MNTQKNNIIIAPSILAANVGNLAHDIKYVVNAGADWIHVDVMDGSFVPPITFGDNVVSIARSATAVPLDVHLMIQNPDLHLERFKDAGSTRIIVHQEACQHLHRTLGEINSLGIKAGVAINPGTPVETVFDVLDLVDLVLVMTVNPGWGGQKFIESSLKKIAHLKEHILKIKKNILIEVDGGINNETAKQCVEAGANVLVAGSYIYGAQDRKMAISSLKK